MNERNGVRKGQQVRDLDGKDLGKVTRLHAWGFETVKGLPVLIRDEYVFRYEEVRPGPGGTLVVGLIIGFIFQFYNLMPVLSAEKNVELPLLLTNLSSKERKKHVAAALDLVGLSSRAKHYPRELSGGQEQRVAIARALVSDPNLLLCDEPTGDLDRATADEILALMQELNRDQQKTILMVTHDPRAAEHAKRTLHLDKGKLVGEV